MPQQETDRQFTDFRPGLITETGYLNSQPGSTSDEANFRLLIDGSRKRRRGLDAETGGSVYTSPETLATTDACSIGRFNNAGGDPDKDFIVAQFGSRLHLWQDTGATLSTQKDSEVINLDAFSTDATKDVAEYPVAFASGNGLLLVVGRYISPFFVEYNVTSGAFTTTTIDIYERDFHTILEDNVTFTTEPTSLSNAHNYNLRNRGFRKADITQYQSDLTKYPALAMNWWKGYRRATAAGWADEDGTKAWHSSKLEAETFGNASAPTGALMISPFDTGTAYLDFSGEVSITGDWSYVDGGATWTLTINTDTVHGLTHPANITISGQSSRYTEEDPEPGPPAYRENVPWSFDGSYTTASVVDTDTFTIVVNEPFGFDSWDDQYEATGVVFDADANLENTTDNYSTNERPTACAWFAGRAWYAGTRYSELADRIWFSPVARVKQTDQLGYCFQRNDPTSEEFSELLADDGGTIVISDMGRVSGMLPYNGVLLVFSDEGVWEISGSRGVFTADNYSVRKVTDFEAVRGHSANVCGSVVLFASPKGGIMIRPDERTGILYGINITEQKIQTEWNSIPEAKLPKVRVLYDDANKQVNFLYSDDTADTYAYEYDRALVWDMRLDAWSKLTWPSAAANYIMGAVAISDADASGEFGKLKFLVQTTTRTEITVCDHNQTDYIDFDGNDEDGFMNMAYDDLGSWAHRRQAPYVHTYCAKTETGYTDPGGVPINASSVTMQARWDWSDHTNANEWGTATEVYRHVRVYTPPDFSDPFNSGYPVVFTRNKVRGRGRSLHLRFSTTDTYDAHLLGYHIRYKVSRRV
jgi:hypothetical protein